MSLHSTVSPLTMLNEDLTVDMMTTLDCEETEEGKIVGETVAPNCTL